MQHASSSRPWRMRVTRWSVAALALVAFAGLSCKDSFPTAPTSVAQVMISPTAPTLIVGDTVRLKATAVDENFTGIDGKTATWFSGDNTVASVSNGLVTALKAGTAVITADIDGKTDTTTVTVIPPPVDSVFVSPPLDTIILGLSRQLTATTFDAAHNVLTGRAITWQTDGAGIATVSATGLVTAVGLGSTTIRATAEGRTGTATIVVIPVPVKQVVVTPNPAQVQQGATLALDVSTRDSIGGVLTGRLVTFQSLNTGIATVNAAGVVTGVLAGATTIRVTSEGIVTDVPLTVAVPVIQLGATTASFTAKARQANPPAQAITITNAGPFTLSGLSVSVSYGAGASGWLGTSLSSTTAPATLTLAPLTGVLDPGVYTATVTVSSSQPGVASRTVNVTFTVVPFPIIALSNHSPQFAAQANGVLPAAQNVTVTNSGTGSLTGLGLATSYGPGATGWLAASLNTTAAPATITLQPNTTALAVGTYTARVVVSTSADASVLPDTISVTYVVAQGPIIGLSRTTVGSTVQAFQVKHDTQTVNITNPGGGTLSGLSTTVTYNGPTSGWLAASLTGTTAPATLILDLNGSSLAAGTYSATVTVSSSVVGVQSQDIAVTFTVTPQPVIAVSAATASFTATRGGALPGAQGITVTNSGGGTLSGLSVEGIAYGAGATGWLNASLGGTTAPTTLTLQPNTTTPAAAGTYTAVVTLGSTVPGVADRTVSVSYTIQQPQIALSATTIAYGSQTRGFSTSDAVTVSNGGQGTLSGLSVSSNAGWLTASLNTTTAPATLTLTTNTTSLGAGSYTGIATVSSSLPGVASQTVTVTVTVLQPSISLGATSFVRSTRPSSTGATVSNNTFSVSNGGSGTLSGLSVSDNASWLTASLNTTTAPATVTLVYSTVGLGVGSYSATVTVASTVPGVTSQTVSVTLNVDWSFASDISPLLATCTGCHQSSESDINYNANFSVYSQIVNAATHTDVACDGRTRIVPSNVAASALYQKLTASPPCGVRMPQGGPYWSASDLTKLSEWISRGAPNN